MPQIRSSDRAVVICVGDGHVVDRERQPVFLRDVPIEAASELHLRGARGIHVFKKSDVGPAVDPPAYAGDTWIAAVGEILRSEPGGQWRAYVETTRDRVAVRSFRQPDRGAGAL